MMPILIIVDESDVGAAVATPFSACSSVHTNRAICVGEADRQTQAFSAHLPPSAGDIEKDAYG
jgi:hypothetical protein